MQSYRWVFFRYDSGSTSSAVPVGTPITVMAESDSLAQETWKTIAVPAEATDLAMLFDEAFRGICTKYRGRDYDVDMPIESN